MGFQYRLEALRRYRHFQEETCQKEFSEAQRRYERERQRLLELVEARRKTESTMQDDSENATTGPHLVVYTRYLQRLARQITAQQRRIREAQELCEEKRQRLIIAMQKRKTLEKLKANSLKQYLQHLNHEEEKFINEMAINRHILNHR